MADVSRTWATIVYQESCKEDWIDDLEQLKIPCYVSPLHDKDISKDGTLKKAHWHVIIVVDKRTGYIEMNNIMRNLTHCPYIQKCRSLRNAYDYFLHINAPEKYQAHQNAEAYIQKSSDETNHYHSTESPSQENLSTYLNSVYLILFGFSR